MKLNPQTLANHWCSLAELAVATHRPAVAERCLERAAALGGESPRSLLVKARLHVSLDRLRDAEDVFARLLREHGDDAALWLEAGELADAQGADEPALRRLWRAVELADDDVKARALTALAKVDMHAGRLAQAGRCWWQVTRIQPDDAHAWAGLLVCALAAGKSRLAGRISDTLDAMTSPDERRAIVAAAWPHLAGALEFRRAREHQMQDAAPPAPKRPASVLRDMLDHAVVVLNAHADEHPQRADAHYHLAVAQFATDAAPAAALSVRTAVRINPRYKAANELREQLKAA